ncbi:MAG: hypothetical protein H7145_09835, partial [Akkermansiaceae bacterium]|nr:hypothetical protein [Armatimonadota bacterium]
NEKLAFPIIQLPLAMTEPDGTLWRSRLVWVGFAVAFLTGLVNGVHDVKWHTSTPVIMSDK